MFYLQIIYILDTSLTHLVAEVLVILLEGSFFRLSSDEVRRGQGVKEYDP